MGHAEVFTHVGDAVRVRAPDGRMVAPVVTGKPFPCTTVPFVSEGVDVIGVFGADDFMHSLFSGQFFFLSVSLHSLRRPSVRGLRPHRACSCAPVHSFTDHIPLPVASRVK